MSMAEIFKMFKNLWYYLKKKVQLLADCSNITETLRALQSHILLFYSKKEQHFHRPSTNTCPTVSVVTTKPGELWI